MAEDLLELESPELEEPEQTEADVVETPEAEQPQEEQEETPGQKLPIPASLFQPDGRKLDPTIKAALGKLKSLPDIPPEAAKMIAKGLYESAAIQREFPGGIEEARELRSKVEELGGVQEIESALQTADEYSNLAKQFVAADPAFVQDMVDSDPGAFLKLVPSVLGKYAELHPNGFRQYFGNVVQSDLDRNGIPTELRILENCIRLKDMEGLATSFVAIRDYLNGYKTLSTMRVEEPQLKAAEPKANTTDQREMELRGKEWGLEYKGIEGRIVREEYQSALAGRKPSAEEKAQIQELFLARRASLAKQYYPDGMAKLGQLKNRNDKAGYMRLSTAILKRVTPEAMRHAVARTLKGAAPSRTAAPAAPKPQQARPVAQNTNGGGTFKFVSTEPGSYDVDYDRTSAEMLRNNRAVLRNGDRVQWRVK